MSRVMTPFRSEVAPLRCEASATRQMLPPRLRHTEFLRHINNNTRTSRIYIISRISTVVNIMVQMERNKPCRKSKLYT